MKITHCQTNHLNNPVGFRMDAGPVFHWTVEGARGTRQESTRVVVRELAQLATSGEVVADTGFANLDSLACPVGVPLKPRTRYAWTVTVKTNAGEMVTSDENFFETGKMDEPWQAEWVTTDKEPLDLDVFDRGAAERHPVFSKKICLKNPQIAYARLYITGLGLYEAFIDGKRIGDEYLTPYCNNYDAWVQYQTYDVTKLLTEAIRHGTPALSVLLGNGWYKGRFGFMEDPTPVYGSEWKLLAELRVTYTDGTEEVIGTDESWEVTRSNIIFSNIYDGEWRDDTLSRIISVPVHARKTNPPQGRLSDRLSPPVRKMAELHPVQLIHTPKGELVLDLGQNQAGIWKLHVHGVKYGGRVHVQVGEVLQQGNFYRDNLRDARAEYWYTSDGTDRDIEPHFTFYGYRYVKIEGMPDLKSDDFTAYALWSDMDAIGSLETGNPKINRLLANAEWGKRSNFIDVPTDCPQRNERMGWTGDAEVFSPTALTQSDAYAFYTKYLYDMVTEQRSLGGMVPNVVPSFHMTETDDAAWDGALAACAWGDATTIIPWNVYAFTGDKTILAAHFPAMKAWCGWLTARDADGLRWMKQYHYGDWLALDGPGGVDAVDGGTDTGYCAEVYLLYSLRITAETAKLLGYAQEAASLETQAGKILDRIRHYYFTPSGRCAVDTQTAYLLALRHGLSTDPAQMKEGLIKKLHANGDKLQTGFIGTPLLCEILTEIDRSDLAYHLLFNEAYPGWLYEVNLGATTIWERWNSLLPDGTVSSTGMNSYNHYSYGAIATWIYERAAGLRRDPSVPGFRKVLFTPLPDARLGYAHAVYDSAAGKWECGWELTPEDAAASMVDTQSALHGIPDTGADKRKYKLHVYLTVPFGAEADVTLPDAPESVYEDSSNPLFASVDMNESSSNGEKICHVGPGRYEVSYELHMV